MTEAPAWIEALREDSARAAELGLRWLEPDERAATTESWRALWNQIPYDDTFHAENAERLERSVPLFEGPRRHRRMSKAASQMVVVHDPKEPELVWLSLSHAMPALAWATGGASPEELAKAVLAYSPDLVPGTLDLERHERVVKPMELSGIELICRGIEAMEVWMDDVIWGGAYVEDPWQSIREDAGVMLLSAHLERVREQHPGRPESFGFRTLWSKSILTVERHPYDLWVFDLRYRPASDRRVIEGLTGSEPGRRLPPDRRGRVTRIRHARHLRDGLVDGGHARRARARPPRSRGAHRPGRVRLESVVRAPTEEWSTQPRGLSRSCRWP